MIGYNISNSLSISSRPRPAAVYMISDPGQLISHSVSDVGPGSGTGVGPDDDTTIKLTSHNGCARAVRGIHPVHGRVRVCVDQWCRHFTVNWIFLISIHCDVGLGGEWTWGWVLQFWNTMTRREGMLRMRFWFCCRSICRIHLKKGILVLGIGLL